MSQTKETNCFKFGKYFASHKVGLFFYVFIYLVTGAIDIFATISFARLIEMLTTSMYMPAIRLILFLSVFLVLQRCLYLVNGLNYCKLYVAITNKMSVDVAEQAFKISSQSYAQHNTASFMQRISSDPRMIFENIGMIINQGTDVVSNIVMFAYICTINIWVGMVAIVGICISSLIERWRRTKRKKNRREMRVANEKVDSLLNEIIRSERDVKSLNLEQTLKEKTAEGFNEYKKKYMTFENWDWSLWSATSAFIVLLQSVILVLSVVFMDKGLMTLASFMIIYSNRHSFFYLTRIFGNVSNALTDISLAKERINELFTNEEYKVENFGRRTLKNVKGHVEFKSVEFSYPEFKERDKKEVEEEKKYNKKHKIKKHVAKRIEVGRKQVLNDINFIIEPNTTVSFVGISGSGKSTILNLISKMNEVDKGKVLIDGVNINTLSKETLRSTISLVNQFPYIFDMTIKENLLLAKPNATDEEINFAIKESALEDFIAELPEGVNTRVGESGIKLSGGQKQRLAIARAMLRKSPIILFDESTSSLDNLSQSQVKKSIDNIKGKSTIVIVAHRLSTIKNVDKIFFIEKGQIVDSGTFEELYKRNKKFKTIFLAENLE